ILLRVHRPLAAYKFGPGPGNCKVGMSDALDRQPYRHYHRLEMHTDEGIAYVDPGMGLDALYHDGIIKCAHGCGSSSPACVGHRDNRNFGEVVSFRHVPLDYKAPVEMLAALHGKGYTGSFKGFSDTIQDSLGDLLAACRAYRLSPDLAGGTP